MYDSLMQKGLMLMAAGMGTVFVFLTLLVLMLNVMSRVVALFPAPVKPDAPGNNEQEVAAIAAAITLHRRRR
jgi:oxaloacetate decarboxylase gamma subunit